MGRLVLQRETALKSVAAQLGSRHPLAGRPRTQRGKHRFPPSATARRNPPAGCDRRAPASAQRCDGPVATCCLFPCRGGRDWTEHSQRLEEHQERAWPGTVDGGTAGREHVRWQGGERVLSGPSGPGHLASRGGMSGRGGFAQGGHSQGHVVPGGGLEGGGLAGQDRGSRVLHPHPHPYPHFTRRY
uniref:Scaffold attachment factor B2 n=1 Tax=Rousettus aegyptiacus TaxID=9407 RepID=A0A7J8BVN9_ROUAE|nr:scaffold attachment factor B2 [Rousettus aegyptiacus]